VSLASACRIGLTTPHFALTRPIIAVRSGRVIALPDQGHVSPNQGMFARPRFNRPPISGRALTFSHSQFVTAPADPQPACRPSDEAFCGRGSREIGHCLCRMVRTENLILERLKAVKFRRLRETSGVLTVNEAKGVLHLLFRSLLVSTTTLTNPSIPETLKRDTESILRGHRAQLRPMSSSTSLTHGRRYLLRRRREPRIAGVKVCRCHR